MAKNKVQFQKSMTIHAFMNKFGSEAQCRKQLLRIPAKLNSDSGPT